MRRSAKGKIVWFDLRTDIISSVAGNLKGAGYEIQSFSQREKIFEITGQKEIFSGCILILIDPLHFERYWQELITKIKKFAKCKAPVVFFTLKSDFLEGYEYNRELLTRFGVKDVWFKGNLTPKEIPAAIENLIIG